MDKKLFDSIMQEAIKLTQKQDFEAYTNVEFKKNIGITKTEDFIKGMKIGHIIGMTHSLYNKKMFDDLLIIVKDFISTTKNTQSSS